MDLEDLLLHPPSLHADREGRAVSWRAGDGLLRCLDGKLGEGDATLETGAGVTTLVFAMRRCRHTAVVPDQAQVDRILAWCDRNGVRSDTLTFQVMPSEDALPRLDPAPLDLVLIDGAHSFPIPLLDWFYAGRRLRAGGTLIVDDMKIWTSRVLYDVLAKDPEWRIEHRKRLEFFAATRVSCGPLGEWLDQPFVRHHSLDSASTSVMRRTAGAVVQAAQLAQGALALARRREWAEFRHRLAEVTGAPGNERPAAQPPSAGPALTGPPAATAYTEPDQ